MPLSESVKPDPQSSPTREAIERARALYQEGFTTSRIAAATDMSLGTLYYWLDGGPVENGEPLLPPIPRRRQVVGRRRRVLDADRVSLAARLWRMAERQVRDIEERLLRPGSGPERERDTRMLTLLIRGLRDLSAIEAKSSGAAAQAHDDAAADDDPREIEDLRRDLYDRIMALRAQADENARGGAQAGPRERAGDTGGTTGAA